MNNIVERIINLIKRIDLKQDLSSLSGSDEPISRKSIFGTWGFALTMVGVLLLRTYGMLGKCPYFLDEVSVSLAGIRMFTESGLVSIHPHAGMMLIVGVMLKMLSLKATYESALMMINIIGIAPMIACYFFIRSWTKNNALAWMCALAVGLCGPLLFTNYMLYGTTPATLFIFLSACLLINCSGRKNVSVVSYIFLSGLFCGIAYTCHESSVVMSCAIWGAMVLWSLYIYKKKVHGLRSIALWNLMFVLGLLLPIVFFNNIVPVFYSLILKKDFTALVANHSLDFGFSGQARNYIGSLIEPWKRLGGGVALSFRFSSVIELIYLMSGKYFLMLSAVGLYFCLSRVKARLLASFMIICVIWCFGASFSPEFPLRLVAPAIVMLAVFAGCGWYQLYVWASKLKLFIYSDKIKYLVMVVFIGIGLVIAVPALRLISHSGTGYNEMTGFLIGKNADFRRVLSSNHLVSWYYLRNEIFINNKKFEEAYHSFDYVVLETANLESLTYFEKHFAKPFAAVTPVAVFDNNLGQYDYYPAEGRLNQLLYIKKNSEISGFKRDKLYIFKMSDARLQ